MEPVTKEGKEIIEEISKKYGYEDDLKEALQKVIPAMLEDVSDENIQLFYQMLRHTPIIITENLDQEEYEALKNTYLGDIRYFEEENEPIEAYYKNLGAGAYVSSEVVDENMQVIGKKSFIYIQKFSEEEEIQYYGSTINIPHLIHELGHAWNAEKNQYQILEDGTFVDRTGTYLKQYTLETKDGKFIKKQILEEGLFLEEAINTAEEESALSRYLNIPEEKLKILTPSIYQPFLSTIMKKLTNTIVCKKEIEQWRMTGDKAKLEELILLLEQTEYWKNREDIFLKDKSNSLNYEKKKEIISKVQESRIQEFFKENEELFFPNVTKQNPMQRMDNILKQIFTFKKESIRLINPYIPEEKQLYSDLITFIMKEANELIVQAGNLKNEKQTMNDIKQIANQETLSRINAITTETKRGIKAQEKNIDNKQQGDVNRNE